MTTATVTSLPEPPESGLRGSRTLILTVTGQRYVASDELDDLTRDLNDAWLESIIVAERGLLGWEDLEPPVRMAFPKGQVACLAEIPPLSALGARETP